jgi:hypothetical protein
MRYLSYLALSLISLFLTSCEKGLELFQEKDLLERPTSKRCAECHENIYNQFKESRHAMSWISPEFKRGSENYSKEKCLSCHAPYEITINEKPKLRDVHREDGVNCVACHFRDSTKSMHGPYNVFSPPHPSTQDLTYTKAEICSGCHQETYKQWKMVSTDKNCQQCHMPAEKESLIQKFPFTYMHLPKEVHHHGFIVPKSKPEFFEVKAEKTDKTLRLTILNKKVPHNVPTADNGKPKYYVDVTFFKDGKEVYSDSITVLPNDSFVNGKEKVLEFNSVAEFDKVKVVLSRKLSWQEKPEKIESYDF